MNEFVWKWTTLQPLPDKVLAVFSRTEYTQAGWEEVKEMHDAACERFFEDPNMLGLSSFLDADETAVYGVTAWQDYDALERFVQNQLVWLRGIVVQVKPKIVLRHNAYRSLMRTQFPVHWDETREIIQRVRRVSPLGADVFPELSEALGMDTNTEGVGR